MEKKYFLKLNKEVSVSRWTIIVGVLLIAWVCVWGGTLRYRVWQLEEKPEHGISSGYSVSHSESQAGQLSLPGSGVSQGTSYSVPLTETRSSGEGSIRLPNGKTLNISVETVGKPDGTWTSQGTVQSADGQTALFELKSVGGQIDGSIAPDVTMTGNLDPSESSCEIISEKKSVSEREINGKWCRVTNTEAVTSCGVIYGQSVEDIGTYITYRGDAAQVECQPE